MHKRAEAAIRHSRGWGHRRRLARAPSSSSSCRPGLCDPPVEVARPAGVVGVNRLPNGRPVPPRLAVRQARRGRAPARPVGLPASELLHAKLGVSPHRYDYVGSREQFQFRKDAREGTVGARHGWPSTNGSGPGWTAASSAGCGASRNRGGPMRPNGCWRGRGTFPSRRSS